MTQTYIFWLSFLAAFLGAVAILSIPLSSRTKVRQSLDRLNSYDRWRQSEVEEEAGFGVRIIWPLVTKLGRIAKRRVSSESIERVREKLTLAGARSLSAEQFIALKWTAAGALLVLDVLYLASWFITSGRPSWLALPLIAVAYFLPDLWLLRRISRRQDQISVALPDALDMLTIALEAGLSFDSAMAKVSKYIGGPLGDEFNHTLWDIQVGATRREALRNLGRRSNVSDLRNFCTTVVQAEGFGISISNVLRSESAELRTRRRQSVEEKAMKTPVKLVFPVVLVILPALIMVIIGPGAIRIASTLLEIGG